MSSEPTPDPQTSMVLGYLGAQRRHVLGILEGLDDEAMRRPVLPSGWSCVGLVQHLARDVERFWFRGAVAAEPEVTGSLDEGVDAWQVGADVPVESVLADYRDQIERADAIIAATSLDAAPAWWPEELFGGWRLEDLREVMLHVITETACHAGHLDAARELIDGRRWMVLD